MFFRRPKTLRSGLPEWDGKRFELDDPRVPPTIRQLAQDLAGGNTDWYFFFADTHEGGEWWLFDAVDEFAESFWLEK